MKWSEMICMFLAAGIVSIAGAVTGYPVKFQEVLIGYGFLLVITLLGIAITRVLPFKMPMVFWISILAILSTSSISPIAKVVTEYTNKVDFLALCTPILAYAGLSVGKDLEMFKKMSWRIVVVALAVYTGTFVFATFVAQMMLHVEGII